MIGATWALRAAREVYHPWYARPDRLFLLLLAVGIDRRRGVWRALGAWLPARAHGLRHPVVAWSVALPVWIALARDALWLAPAAAYLWTLPLLAAGAARWRSRRRRIDAGDPRRVGASSSRVAARCGCATPSTCCASWSPMLGRLPIRHAGLRLRRD